ncbi:MAG: amidohydrolase/deacetylase family metallohydrolase [Vicinamibacterales bacterium]
MTNRREFLGTLAALPALGLWAGVQPEPAFDLVIAGGRVIDPVNGIDGPADVGITNGRIVRVGPGLARGPQTRVIDAGGRIVTPGLIDVHVHVFDGIAGVAAPADAGSLAHGVTTVVDGGSAGATTFAGFRKYIIEPSRTRIYAALNISTVGLVTLDELANPAWVDPKAAVATILANRERIVAIKVRLTPSLAAGRDLEVLGLARQASEATGVPLMVHIGGSPSPLDDIVAQLRKGDMLTHTLREDANGVLDQRGRVRQSFVEARERGVIMDVAHGSGNFSWETAEKAADQDWWPDTISSDLHARNIQGPVIDLPATLSKFVLLGLPLEAAIARATSAAARAFPFPDGCGTLSAGAVADVAVFRWDETSFTFTDSRRQTRRGPRGLVPDLTIRAGEPIVPA